VINYRRFENKDGKSAAELIAKTMLETNIRDYSRSFLDRELEHLKADDLIERSQKFHCYVFVDDDKIIAIGSIGPYWNSKNESCLFNIFVDPKYQGQGIGRKLIQVLEEDPYFTRAKRIEIPASITGLKFYLKMGYHFKDNNHGLDENGYYRLEKFK
jgi:GNAT superfamily N-acetyltransferase